MRYFCCPFSRKHLEIPCVYSEKLEILVLIVLLLLEPLSMKSVFYMRATFVRRTEKNAGYSEISITFYQGEDDLFFHK